MDALFLGLDCSTQTLKATIIDSQLNELGSFETIVQYDTDLPQYETKGGVTRRDSSSAPTVATTPT